jgi:Sec-independent protein translocase protein TatA
MGRAWRAMPVRISPGLGQGGRGRAHADDAVFCYTSREWEQGCIMEFLGIGGWELVAILLIMLIFAGPKRMIQWSYVLGRWIGVARNMWAQTAQQLQQELNQSGLDIEIPKDIPTRASIGGSVAKFVSDVSKPVVEPLNEVRGELESARSVITPGDPVAFRAARANTAAPARKPDAPASLPAPSGKPAAEPPPVAPPPVAPPPADSAETGYGAWSQ